MSTASLFGTAYQGGAAFEILNTKGKNPIEKWKVFPGPRAIAKEYERSCKGYVYNITGNAQTKLQLPADDKKCSLGLTQPFLVFQLRVPLGKPLAIEIGFNDQYGTRRRVLLSTSFTEPKMTPLHCRVPLVISIRDVWLNLCLDLQDLVSSNFAGQTFHSLEILSISAWCQLRRVFTLRQPPPNEDDHTPRPTVPIPAGLDQEGSFTQVVHMDGSPQEKMPPPKSTPQVRQVSASRPQGSAVRPKTSAAAPACHGQPVRTRTPPSSSRRTGRDYFLAWGLHQLEVADTPLVVPLGCDEPPAQEGARPHVKVDQWIRREGGVGDIDSPRSSWEVADAADRDMPRNASQHDWSAPVVVLQDAQDDSQVRKSLADRRALLASIEHSLDGEVSPGRHDVKLPSEGRSVRTVWAQAREGGEEMLALSPQLQDALESTSHEEDESFVEQWSHDNNSYNVAAYRSVDGPTLPKSSDVRCHYGTGTNRQELLGAPPLPPEYAAEGEEEEEEEEDLLGDAINVYSAEGRHRPEYVKASSPDVSGASDLGSDILNEPQDSYHSDGGNLSTLEFQCMSEPKDASEYGSFEEVGNGSRAVAAHPSWLAQPSPQRSPGYNDCSSPQGTPSLMESIGPEADWQEPQGSYSPSAGQPDLRQDEADELDTIMQSARQSTSVCDARTTGITSRTWQDLDYEDAVEVPDDSIRASVDGLAFPSDEEGEESEIDLLYDPQLNCYYDPRTNQYYELDTSS